MLFIPPPASPAGLKARIWDCPAGWAAPCPERPGWVRPDPRQPPGSPKRGENPQKRRFWGSGAERGGVASALWRNHGGGGLRAQRNLRGGGRGRCPPPPQSPPGGDPGFTRAAKTRRRPRRQGVSRAVSCPPPRFLSVLPFVFKLCLVGAIPPVAPGRGKAQGSPQPHGGHPALSPQQGRGPELPDAPFSLFGARSWAEVTASRRGERKAPGCTGLIQAHTSASLLQPEYGNMFETESKAGSDAAVPMSREL